MCGIVCYYGQAGGVSHVLEALTLLEYRAPDSTGLSVINEDGKFSLSRSVGTARDLIRHLRKNPLYLPPRQPAPDVEPFLDRQSLPTPAKALRDCSPTAGYQIHDLFHDHGLQIGRGDRGSPTFHSGKPPEVRFSSKLTAILEDWDLDTNPDFDLDPVRHAFRLLAAHVTSQIHLHPELKDQFTGRLQERLPAGAYRDWLTAWREEVALNIPGQAFGIAVEHFQGTFPGLEAALDEEDQGRVGGLTARAMSQVVMGHGRWAMVGAVTAENTHPFLDRSQTRAVCENGSHNANLLLETRVDQQKWWEERGLPAGESAHRSDNTTEVIAYEWERAAYQIETETLPDSEGGFLTSMEENGIFDREEQALRLCLQRLKEGNAHACSFHSLHHPGRLYVSSHNKPIAIVKKAGASEPPPMMIASDVNAALMLWPGPEVDQAAARIKELHPDSTASSAEREGVEGEIQTILDQFQVEVQFLDHDIAGGEELLVRIENQILDGKIHPQVRVTQYDGTPIEMESQTIKLNPSMVGKGGYPSYTEYHIAEIPAVLERIKTRYLRGGSIRLASQRKSDDLYSPGLNEAVLQDRFGKYLQSLERILLIGEGSSWRDAKAVAPLFQSLLPDVTTAIYHPVEILNLGETVDPASDLVLEVSWSGTTDSVLKSDGWLQEQGILRLGITGRPQSDLGRRTAESAGTLDVQSGVEISVATVKGFEAILMTLFLIGLRLGELKGKENLSHTLQELRDHLAEDVTKAVREVVGADERRSRIQETTTRCQGFNKVAVIGSSPICIEGELKIEELAQIVACPFNSQDVSLRSLMERSAMAEEDRHRTLFLFNATTTDDIQQTQPLIHYLHSLGVYAVVHTIESEHSQRWMKLPHTAVFTSPEVHPYFQPLVDALFFFDFAVNLAYGRGLTPQEVDRPRNLAKSVTTTGAEKREHVEARQEFSKITMKAFAAESGPSRAWNGKLKQPFHQALPINLPMRTALAVLTAPLPEEFDRNIRQNLLLVTDTEATENAGHMAGAAWKELLDVDVKVFRQPLDSLPPAKDDDQRFELKRKGAIPAIADGQRIHLPTDLSPLQLELLGSVYLIGLAVRLASQRGKTTNRWEKGLAQLPFLISDLLSGSTVRQDIRQVLAPYIVEGYDKAQVIGGGQDFASAKSIARSLRTHGFMAEALYTDSAWHGPLAAVGGPDADHDALTFVLATDPLFQPAAMVDTQVYRTRNAPVILVVPEGNRDNPAVQGVNASAVLTLPPLPRPFVALGNAALGAAIAEEMDRMWAERWV